MEALRKLCEKINKFYAEHPPLREAQTQWEQEIRSKKSKKQAKQERIAAFRAKYTTFDGLDPWDVFWAFVFHDARATGDPTTDLQYCLKNGILWEK